LQPVYRTTLKDVRCEWHLEQELGKGPYKLNRFEKASTTRVEEMGYIFIREKTIGTYKTMEIQGGEKKPRHWRRHFRKNAKTGGKNREGTKKAPIPEFATKETGSSVGGKRVTTFEN